MNVSSIWPLAQISDDLYYLDIWQCARYFVAALFKELALITIIEMWGLESRSQSRTSRCRSRLGFYDNVSVSSRILSQVSVSEVTVSATSLSATIVDPTVIYPRFYLRNDHTDSCYCRNWKVTPGPVFLKFLTRGPKEKFRILPESTPVVRIRSHLCYKQLLSKSTPDAGGTNSCFLQLLTMEAETVAFSNNPMLVVRGGTGSG